ncbi:MAG: mechanosensitive ion channel [Candidatus Nanohaloarchaea archaeon]|nr:mechanosensitive ion channel [Candidatus Nanohaloarchaea archaeon]
MSLVGSTLDRAWNSMLQFFGQGAFSRVEIISIFIIIVVGILGGRIVSELIRRLLKMTALDDLAVKSNVQSLLRKLDYAGTLSDLIADLTKIFIYLLVAFAIFKVLGIESVLGYLDILLSFVPRVILALGILIVGFITSSHLGNITIKFFRAGPMSQIIDETEASYPAYRIVGRFVTFIGYIASILVALSVIGVNKQAITLLIGIFGLGLVSIFVISSRDLMKNVAVSFYFQLSNTFTAGEHLEIKDHEGEIVGITPLYTKIKDGSDVYYVPNTELIYNIVRHEK